MTKPGKAAAMLSSALFFLTAGCRDGAAAAERAPAHAGAFYPAEKAEAEKMLKGFLEKASPPAGPVPRALVVPHAGWVYSGATAAWGYKTLAPAAGRITRVILLAPSHYYGYSGIVVNEASYRTPLGVLPLDTGAIATLKSGVFRRIELKGPGEREHSDEVQVPFIRAVLPKAKIVPLVVGQLAPGDAEAAARAISRIVDENTVIIASSDFTHYGVRFDYAPPLGRDLARGLRKLDLDAADYIVRGDGEGFAAFLERTGATICGRNPILILLAVFRANRWRPNGKVLRYATSAETTGDWSSVVGYCAISLGDLAMPPRTAASGAVRSDTEPRAEAEAGPVLTDADGQALLKLSRFVLRRFVADRVSFFKEEELEQFALSDESKGQLGVFVTLKKNHELRGCIGHIIPRFPLYRGVVENTMNAAARDPRFPPVTAGELAEISLEISVMSPLVKVASIDEIQVGRDGLVLTNGSNTGVFLPQVPVEQGWDKPTYLSQLGLKAGLDPNAYRDQETQLYRFTAQVFDEKP